MSLQRWMEGRMAGGPLDSVMSVQDQGHNYSYVFNFEQVRHKDRNKISD